MGHAFLKTASAFLFVYMSAGFSCNNDSCNCGPKADAKYCKNCDELWQLSFVFRF